MSARQRDLTLMGKAVLVNVMVGITSTIGSIISCPEELVNVLDRYWEGTKKEIFWPFFLSLCIT